MMHIREVNKSNYSNSARSYVHIYKYIYIIIDIFMKITLPFKKLYYLSNTFLLISLITC